MLFREEDFERVVEISENTEDLNENNNNNHDEILQFCEEI